MHNRILRIGNIRFFLQDFCDSSGGGAGNGNHGKYHGKHHQTGQNLNGISDECGQIAGG